MIARENLRIPERLIARLWQKRAARQANLRTEGGVSVRVIYPGRSSGAAGPDFRNALLEIEGVGLVRGDVEIHVQQRDWASHGHAGDPNYNGVVLHAVLGAESPTTLLQSGAQAPVLSLGELWSGADAPEVGRKAGLWAVLGLRGYTRPENSEEMGALLDQAGDDRFLARSACFQRFLEEQGPEQTLYEGIMEGLGYRFNQQRFLKLATRASYAALEQGARLLPGEHRAQTLEAWLGGLSGLSTSGTTKSPPLPRVGFGAPLSAKEWHCFRVRPANHPLRRIAGAAALLDRFLDEGLVPGLSRAAESGSPRELLSALTLAGGPSGSGALIGRGRAGDLVVNAVLPFLHALAAQRSQKNAYLDLYHRLGKLQENELTRETASQLMELAWPAVTTNARRQQGLLHLHALLSGQS